MPSAQSALVLQLEVQASTVQRYGAQSWTSRCPQLPSPSQAWALSSALPEQVGGPHTVLAGYFEQLPSPSQTPADPQVEEASVGHIGCACPSGVGEHVPTFPTRLQVRQTRAQSTLQQTPSLQCWEVHSASAAQLAPFIFWPQLPFLQVRPLTQSVSTEHWLKQAPVDGSHENGAHTVEAPSLQLPWPSHWYLPTTPSWSHVPA